MDQTYSIASSNYTNQSDVGDIALSDDFIHQEEEGYDFTFILIVYIFLPLYSFVWNTGMASMVVPVLYDLFHCRLHEDWWKVIVLPHVYVGIGGPAFMAYGLGSCSDFGECNIWGALWWTSTVILPYTGVTCLSYSNLPHQTDTSRQAEHDIESPAVAFEEGSNIGVNFDTVEFVVGGSIRSSTTLEEIESTSTANNSKADIRIPKSFVYDKKVEKKEGTRASTCFECSICMEPYRNLEIICYSRNPDCRHAFHKVCALEWLENNTDCPVCRRPYVGVFPSNDAEE